MATIKRYTKSQNTTENNSGNGENGNNNENTAPKGSKSNPYTQDEYDAIPLGEWKGGYVEEWGYVPEGGLVDGSLTSDALSESFSDWLSDWNWGEYSHPLSHMGSTPEPGGGGGTGEGNERHPYPPKPEDHIGGGTTTKTYPPKPKGLPVHAPYGFVGAVMAAMAYKDKYYKLYKNKLEKLHWYEARDKIKELNLTLHDSVTGLDYMLLKKEIKGEILGYAVVFAGTDMSKWNVTSPSMLPYNPDVDADILQSLGMMSGQYYQALQLALSLKEKLGNVPLTFVGHSLGGGEAALASIVTGCPAITFNPAALSDGVMEWLRDHKYGNDTSHIYRYIMDGDPVTEYQPHESQGTKLPVHNYTNGDAHKIETIINNISASEHIKWD